MDNFWSAFLYNPLLQMALVAGIIASVSSGIVGTYVVVKRIVFISGSIAHSVLGGMGFFLWLKRVHGVTWASPLLGAVIAALLSAILIGWIQLNYRQREDSVIATIWSVGMAIGVVFIAQTPGYNVDLMSFLLGNILWVSSTDILILSLLDGVIVLVVLLLHKRFLALCFDEVQAELQGVPVKGLYLLLLALIAISVVLLIQIVGIVLALTMLTLPATIAGLFKRRLPQIMVLAVILSAVFNVVGTGVSYQLDWPSGATITLLAALSYLCCLVATKQRKA
ncbi:MAG: metal ABC transporter permease [Parachlamydiales bacterium]|nr:metal ABC transporter permease [Parachlamydiales bacterium]